MPVIVSASASLTLTGTTGVGGTANLTLSPGRFDGTSNGTNTYDYDFGTLGVGSKTTTFTVTNSGSSASETLSIECDGSPATQCPNPFTLNHDTCMNTSLAANGGSCTFDFEVTFSTNCISPQGFSTTLQVVGTDVTYITSFMNAICGT